MAPPTIRSIACVPLALSVFVHARLAAAADIATQLGTPGDATFAVECPAGNLPGPGDDGIPGCPFAGTGFESLCLHRVDIDPALFPHAVCSDGTSPSFYVREASTLADENRWVIHLQGGGGCTDEATCRERWCGDNGSYTAALMSNDWNDDGFVDRPEEAWVLGISSNVATNDFATWNHVYVPYCTSDLWLGREGDVDLGSFSVDANGHTYLYAVRNMLRQLGAPWTSVHGYTMPVLDDAEEILFSGTSAGGYGALQNGDWFLDKFPDARVGLVIDGAMDIDPQTLGLFGVWEETTNWPYSSARLATWDAMWQPGGWWHEIDAFIDEDCRGQYEAGGSLEICTSSSWLLRLALGGVPIVQTPTFLRMDLEDPVLSQWITGPNPDGHDVRMGNNGPVPTLQDYTEMMRETMVQLAADPQTDISVHAPRCGQHVGLEHGNAFGGWTTDDTSDVLPRVPQLMDETLRDALWLWFNPGGAFVRDRRIDSDEVDPITGTPIDYSSCP